MKKRLRKVHLERVFTTRPNQMLSTTQFTQVMDLSRQGLSINEIVATGLVSRNSVRKVLRGDRKLLARYEKKNYLKDHKAKIREWFLKCEGHCIPLQRMIKEIDGEDVHLRALQRFCKPFRKLIKETKALANDPERYETAPGVQMQIDFGEKDVVINGKLCRVHFFVAILGFSRRIFVKAYPAENQAAWLDGIESSFFYFGGVPTTVLSDNTRCLVNSHQNGSSAVLNRRYECFAQYWNFTPVASSPYYPQCKGKVERAVRYVKENALVGKEFENLQALNQWLEEWNLGESDLRTVEGLDKGLLVPKERFALEERKLRRVERPRAYGMREETRTVDKMGLIRIDCQFYRVPDAVRNMSVQTLIGDNTIVVSKNGVFIIELDKVNGVYHPKPQHAEETQRVPELPEAIDPRYSNTLQRPLVDYTVFGGSW